MTFFYFFSILVALLLPFSTIAAKDVKPALYVFGDSSVDAGNNNFLDNKNPANHYPYGIDFTGGKATGRYTNGKTLADFVAEYLDVPLPPPYLGLTKEEEKVKFSKTGINYASGGSGILKETGLISGQVLPLEKQTQLFDETVKLYLSRELKDEKDRQAHLANSIFYISTFGNDYAINYFYNENMTAMYTPQAFADHLFEQFTARLTQLHELGARKFVLTSMPPIRCGPKPDHSVGCDDSNLKAIDLYNNLLNSTMTKLEGKLPGSYFTAMQVHSFMGDLMKNTEKYGMEPEKTCCQMNKIGACEDKAPCENRDKYVKFDAAHLTQVVHDLMAKRCIDGQICKPLSIKTLVDTKV